MRPRRTVWIGVVLALLAGAAGAAWLLWNARDRPSSVYLIGNSLTQDLLSQPDHDATGPDAEVAPGFAELLGRSFDASLRWGQPLRVAADEPPRALSGVSHEQVVFQPWAAAWSDDGAVHEPTSTYAQERAALRSLAAQAGDAEVFLYATWADTGESDLDSAAALRRWERPFAGEDQPFFASAAVYERLLRDLAAEGLDLRLIPAGQVFAGLIRDDNGIEASDLMRDPLHASRLGRYAAAATAAAVLTGRDPSSLPLPEYFTGPATIHGEASPPVSEEQAELVRAAIAGQLHRARAGENPRTVAVPGPAG